MDRRTKQRIDLQLLCRLGTDAIRSTPLEGITENISRDGILMRWLDAVPLPAIGTSLTVEFSLPESEDFGPRVMRCETTVVRFENEGRKNQAVGLRIESLKFAEAPEKPASPDLEAMPVATNKVN